MLPWPSRRKLSVMFTRTVLLATLLLLLSLVIAAVPALQRLWRLGDAPLAGLRAELLAAIDHDDDALIAAQEEIARLRAQHAEAQRRLAEFEEILSEAAVDPDSVVLTRARVTALSTGTGPHLAEIDRGAVDQVHRDLPVTIGWSLVGIVIGEQAGRSLVRLITDADSRVPACIIGADGRRLDRGVCAGLGQRRRLDLQMVEDYSGLKIEPGQYVVTAGGPGPVPPDLILGVITAAERDQASDHWRIQLQPLRQVISSVLVLDPAGL